MVVSWLRKNLQAIASFRAECRKAPRRKGAPRFRPSVLVLEDRVLPSTFVVTETLDASQLNIGTNNPTDTNNQVSLRSAIAAANFDGSQGVSDTIDFAPSLNGTTITLTQGQLELASGAGTTIDGGGQITVNGNNTSRVFEVDSGAQVALVGLAIQNGNMVTPWNYSVNSLVINSSGGAIYNAGTLAVTYDTFTDNSADFGGAIANDGMLTVSNSTVATNSVGPAELGAGGGIYNDDNSSLTVSGSTLSSNSATDGGGIYNNGTLTVYNSTLSGNSAIHGGVGGAIFTGAVAGDSYNGGPYNSTLGTASVFNSTFFGNSAQDNAGAIENEFITTVTCSTITDNSATYNAGGIDTPIGVTLTLADTIVAGNNAGGNPDIVGTAIVNYCVIGDTTGASITGTGNILDPSYLGLGGAGNYGGPTQTIPLLPGSPAIAAGTVALAVDANGNPLATDQRGTGFPRTINGTVEIGAVENYGVSLETILQQTLSPSNPVAVQANTATDADNVITAVNQLPSPPNGGSETVTMNLAAGVSFSDLNASPPLGVTLVINGQSGTTTIVGMSPALTVSSGTVIVTGVTLTTATDAPTLLVQGGILTLRNDTIQESAIESNAAIQITGGSLDLGTAVSPGGNVLNVNSSDQFVSNGTINGIPAVGDTFEVNGAVVAAPPLSSPNTGIVLLDPTGQSLNLSGNANLNVSNDGAVYVNSSNAAAGTLSGKANITATQIDLEGGLTTSGHGVIQGVVNKGVPAIPDPLAGLGAPQQPTTQFSAGSYSGTLQPGTYVGGITVSGNNSVTLQPGIYYLKGGGLTVSGNATVTGTCVMLYITGVSGSGASSVNLSGNANITLTPPTSGTYQGIVLFQDRTSTAAINISGNAALNTTGTVYAPGAKVNLSGNDNDDNPTGSSLGSEWVVADLALSGNAKFTMTADANNRTENPNAFMVAGGPAHSVGPMPAVTMAQANAAVTAALGLWQAAGLDATTLAALGHAKVTIAVLPAPYLGLAAPGAIYLDTNAEGYGWFTNNSPAAAVPAGQIDLVTVVAHELGHLFGLMDDNGTALMAPTLAAGMRIIPNAADLLAPHTTLIEGSVATGVAEAAGLQPNLAQEQPTAVGVDTATLPSKHATLTSALEAMANKDVGWLPMLATEPIAVLTALKEPGEPNQAIDVVFETLAQSSSGNDYAAALTNADEHADTLEEGLIDDFACSYDVPTAQFQLLDHVVV